MCRGKTASVPIRVVWPNDKRDKTKKKERKKEKKERKKILLGPRNKHTTVFKSRIRCRE